MQIATERLILREFEEGDWPAVLAYQRDPLYLRYYEWEARTPDAVREFVGMFLGQQSSEPRIKFQLAVALKSSGQLIGNCGIRKDSVGAHEADIGYELAPDHWGHGYATEAASAILDFGFTGLRVHRISASCVADNVGSARVLENLGMRLEGRLRDKDRYKDRWWDQLRFAILDDEWLNRQQDRRYLKA